MNTVFYFKTALQFDSVVSGFVFRGAESRVDTRSRFERRARKQGSKETVQWVDSCVQKHFGDWASRSEDIHMGRTTQCLYQFYDPNRFTYEALEQDALVAVLVEPQPHSEHSQVFMWVAAIPSMFSERVDAFVAAFRDESIAVEEQEKNGVYMLTLGNNGHIDLGRLPDISKELEPSNYDPDALGSVQKAFDNLLDPDPFGRLLLLTGVPGTGKTYLIRSLLRTSRPARFIFLPPDYVSTFSGPEVIGRLIELNDSLKAYDGQTGSDPLILIVEDGDKCLLRRGTDNMSEISNLLNLTSGLMADAFNIRVLVTANTEITDMDPAIRRPGRLHDTIDVPKLSVDAVHDIVCRELDRHGISRDRVQTHMRDATLAEAYRQADEIIREYR